MPAVRVLYGTRDKYEIHPAAVREIESIFGIKWSGILWDGKVQVPDLPEDNKLKEDLSGILDQDKISLDPERRLIHSFGLSSVEIAGLKAGRYPEIVDAVVEPEAKDLPGLIAFLKSRKIYSIIYGGGTSVNGSLHYKRKGLTIAISTDRLKEYRVVDNIAIVGSGWKGGELEKKLNESGLTAGHFPESMLASTVGGWVATKAAGQESNYYGSIEDRTIGAVVVRSDGIIRDTISPRESSGLMAKDIALGSEGRYGVITEVALKVQSLPEKRFYRAFILRDFESGIDYMKKLDGIPAVVRLSDAEETGFSLNNNEESFGIRYVRSRIRSMGFEKPCLIIMIDNDQDRIVKPPRSISLGRSPAVTWERDRFERPYLGNELWKRGIIPDTLETSAIWDNMATLHSTTLSEFEKVREARGFRGFIMSHISHVYKQGACIYFTFAIMSGNEIEDLSAVREAILNNFMTQGSPVTHHHGPGTLMRKYVEKNRIAMQALLMDPIFSEVE